MLFLIPSTYQMYPIVLVFHIHFFFSPTLSSTSGGEIKMGVGVDYTEGHTRYVLWNSNFPTKRWRHLCPVLNWLSASSELMIGRHFPWVIVREFPRPPDFACPESHPQSKCISRRWSVGTRRYGHFVFRTTAAPRKGRMPESWRYHKSRAKSDL